MRRTAVKHQSITYRRAKAQLTPQRLGFLALRHQLEQRLLEKQYVSFHRFPHVPYAVEHPILHESVADRHVEAKGFSVAWTIGNMSDTKALTTFVDRYLRNDWFARERVIVSRLMARVSLLGWHGDTLICWACVSPTNILYNLLVSPDYQGCHIGHQALAWIQPDFVRSMSNISTGDPEPFYLKAGFVATGQMMGRKRNMRLMRPTDSARCE